MNSPHALARRPAVVLPSNFRCPMLNTDTRMSSARPIADVLAITKNTNSSVCYNAVTALTKRFWQDAVGPARPPRPFVRPITPASGGQAAAVPQVLELPPLFFAP